MLVLYPRNTALIIVDVQVDFCSPEGKSAKYGGGLKHIGTMLPNLKLFHEKISKMGLLTIFTRYISKEIGRPSNLELLTSLSKLFPVCVEGTSGSEIYKLHPTPKDIMIDKLYYDAFAGTTLLAELRKNGIQNILITGVWTEICVDTTAKRALAEGFNVIILKDLVSTIDERVNRHNTVLEDFDRYFGFVKSSNEILELLENK